MSRPCPLKSLLSDEITIEFVSKPRVTCLHCVIGGWVGVITGFVSQPHGLSMTGVGPLALVTVKCALP